MKFVQREMGEAAEASSGGGDRGLLKEILTLGILVVITITVIYFGVVAITEAVVARLSPEKEQEWFGGTDVWFKSQEVPGELKERFTRCEEVLKKLSLNKEVLPLHYQLVYMEDSSPNAFAIPGGRIAVTRGLLESLDEEIAIAFVMGHELGHFAGRDHLRGLGRRLGFGLGVRLLFGGDLDSLSQGATDLVLARYSREQESRADEFGVRCILATYGETRGAEALFRILEAKHAIPKWAYMFSTHPDNESRIRRILEVRKARH